MCILPNLSGKITRQVWLCKKAILNKLFGMNKDTCPRLVSNDNQPFIGLLKTPPGAPARLNSEYKLPGVAQSFPFHHIPF